MIKTTFINSSVAEYTDKEISWVQDLLLTKGYFENEDTSKALDITVTPTASRSILVKPGKVLVPYVKSGVTFKVIVENTADVTLASSPTPIAGYYDYVIVKVDTTVEPTVTKSNVATIELVRLASATDADSGIQAIIGSNYSFLRIGYVNVAAVTDFLTGDIAYQAEKIKLTKAINVSNESVTYPVGYFTGATYPTSPEVGRTFYKTTSPVGFQVWSGTAWELLSNDLAQTFSYTAGESLAVGDALHFGVFQTTQVTVDGTWNEKTSISSTSLTKNITVGNNTNRFLLVSIHSPFEAVTGVTYDGAAMTSLVNSGASGNKVCSFYMKNPTVGSSLPVTVTCAGSTPIAMSIASFYNVDQTTPIESQTGVSNIGSGDFSQSLTTTEYGSLSVNLGTLFNSGGSLTALVHAITNTTLGPATTGTVLRGGNVNYDCFMTIGASVLYPNSIQFYYGGGGPSQISGAMITLNLKTSTAPTRTVMKASAVANSFYQPSKTNFIGFSKSAVTAGTPAIIAFAGISNNLTGLNPEKHYYLSNTAGAIQETAGSVSKKVGLALSSTEILIKNENN